MLTKQESVFVSISRVLAMLMIVACHILQAYDNNWAYVFNDGVQMFFLLSGFLYGRKDDIKYRNFLLSRLKKVYFPYLIYFAITVLCLTLFSKVQISWNQIVVYVLNLQGFVGKPIEGLNHLWFLSVLMLCYVLTPVIKKLLRKKFWVTVLGLLIIAIVEYLLLQKKYALFTWVALYVLGIIIGEKEIKYAKWVGLLSVCATVLIFSALSGIDALNQSAYSHISVWLHVSLSLSILTIFYFVLTKLLTDQCKVPRIFGWLDKYSYEIYLVYHLFILGSCSMLFVFNNKLISIVLVIVCTMVSAVLIKLLSKILIK